MADDSETDENMSDIDDGDNDPNDSDYEVTPTRRVKRSASGKYKVYYDNRMFKPEWVDIFPWVEEDQCDPKFANCNACNKKMKALKGVLEAHQRTKRHLKNLCGSDDIDDEDSPKKPERPSEGNASAIPGTSNMYSNLHANPPQFMEQQLFGEDQFNLFGESPIDAAHQAITSLIDKLVEKYHENRVENLKIQNEAILQLTMERAAMKREEQQRQLELRLLRQKHVEEIEAVKIAHAEELHEMRLRAMEVERDTKMKGVEQQLLFVRQEYKHKVKMLDHQLTIYK